jgi:3-hydroxy-3-methylglutaryl CoA synthase
MAGIISYGGYIPRYRLSRMVIVQNMAWYFPVIMAVADGEKAVANWDEDSVSMAVAAAYDCMAGNDRKGLDALYFASTTMPFSNRLNAGIVAAALNMREDGVSNADFASCMKAGTTAVIAALESVQAGAKKNVLVAVSDQRRTKMATMFEMFYGDGAAAVLVGDKNVIAEYLGSHSINCDFIDHYKGYGKEFDYGYEERWVRDIGYGKIIPEAISRFLAKSGMAIGEFSKVIYPCYFSGTHNAIAKTLGIEKGRAQNNLHSICGDTGTAHPLVMLAAALEEAKPGDKLLVAGFGQGCDVIAFEVTDKIKDLAPRTGIKGSLANRVELTSYLKFIKYRDLITADLGIRGEANPNTSLTLLWRKRKMLLGLTGVRCKKCGTPQFPIYPTCVNPKCWGVKDFEDYEFSDKEGKILMFTGDMLAPSVDPPAAYGLVAFEGGGRTMFDFTDCDLNQIKVGMKTKMTFRRRLSDGMRGFTGYFWKAVPQVEGGDR